jgi:hypothetical protein
MQSGLQQEGHVSVPLVAPISELDGFVYVDLPDEIIESFMPLIPTDIEHPVVSTSGKYVGAHISVIDPYEFESIRKNYGISSIPEVGQDVEFQIGQIQKATPVRWKEERDVYFVSVDSPRLSSIRTCYGLWPKLNGHDFHITIGVSPKREIKHV